MSAQLQALRQQIDQLDQQIQLALNQRAQLAQQVAVIKQQDNSRQNNPSKINFYRPEREAQILRQIQQRNPGPISDKNMAHVFREIISICLALEQPLTIAYLGPAGTFTQQAAYKHFGQAVNTLACNSINQVFQEVQANNADYGVVPIENSTEGSVHYTLDLLQNTPLLICGEAELRIHHALLAQQSDLSKIEQIVSHQQSFAQCRNWLSKNLACVKQIYVNSNAEAAKIAQTQANTAAIASEMAAEIYQLEVLANHIEDQLDNTTRFLVLGEQVVAASGHDKTSLLLSTHNKPGALYQLLAVFAKHNISMSRIESRPAKQNLWEYIFFIDIQGHQHDSNVALALSQLEQQTTLLKILGSYPSTVF